MVLDDKWNQDRLGAISLRKKAVKQICQLEHSGAQLVPIGIPTVSWKMSPPNSTKMLSMRNSRPPLPYSSMPTYLIAVFHGGSYITRIVMRALA